MDQKHAFLASITENRKLMSRVVGADKFLTTHKGTLQLFASVAELAITYDEGENSLKGAMHHMMVMRNAIVRFLWSQQLFIGLSIVEDALFYTYRDSSATDPIAEILVVLVSATSHGPGLAVFPLHSARFPTTPFAETPEVVSLDLDAEGLQIFPQANSYEAAKQNVIGAAKALGVTAALNEDLLDHCHRSRPLSWLTHNPSLVTRIHNVPGSYYENQRVVVPVLHFCTSTVFGLAALAGGTDDEPHFNTGVTNNFETLDYRHYLVLYPDGQGALAGDCIPLRRRDPGLYETSDLDVYLDADLLQGIKLARFKDFARGVELARASFFGRMVADKADKSRADFRLAGKLASSLRLFRRSFSKRRYDVERTVDLASAFEVLLTDFYSGGVGDVLRGRTERALYLAGIDDIVERSIEVEHLYKDRCAVVHEGAAHSKLQDLHRQRQTYIYVFSEVARHMSAMPPETPQPVAHLLHEAATPPPPRPFLQRLQQFRVGAAQDVRRRWRHLFPSS